MPRCNSTSIFITPILLLLLISFYPVQSARASEIKEEKVMLQFPVFSDVHIGGDLSKSRLREALNDYRILAPNYQAIAMVGDLTNYGAEKEYDDFISIINEYIYPGAEKVITIGNHEYMEGQYSEAGLNEELYRQRFLEKTQMPGLDSQVYYDKWIEGYHFIALGSEGYFYNGDDTDDDYAKISDHQYHWLEEKLAENADASKPIFVFLHQGIDFTVYGTDLWGGGFKDTRLLDILKQYPQVILFSGHSHYVLSHPRTIFQDGFTMVNTGSLGYGYNNIGNTHTSQGLLVKVYPDRVEIKARDFINDTWIQDFTVKTPYEKTYGETNKPQFKLGSTIEVKSDYSGKKAELSWELAEDDTFIEKYIIKQNGEIIQTIYRESLESSLDGKVHLELANLSPDIPYTIEISAIDAWNNGSINSLKTTIQLPKVDGLIKEENGSWRYYENGKVISGWKQINEHWYLFLNNGIMQTGWVDYEGKKYYFGSGGVMQTGWVSVSGKWYFFNSNGTLKLGWVYDAGKWYYVESIGMTTGWKKLGNSWCFFANSGAMQTGWNQSGGKWYYLQTDGAMKTGWLKLNNTYYYLEASGAMKTGWLLENGTWYYLNENGAMQTGWLYIGSVWYYFTSTGALR